MSLESLPRYALGMLTNGPNQASMMVGDDQVQLPCPFQSNGTLNFLSPDFHDLFHPQALNIPLKWEMA
jgi:hypothetical protein